METFVHDGDSYAESCLEVVRRSNRSVRCGLPVAVSPVVSSDGKELWVVCRRGHRQVPVELGVGSDHETSEPELCGWFAHCFNDATTTREHPVLGAVPICDRCDGMVERFSDRGAVSTGGIIAAGGVLGAVWLVSALSDLLRGLGAL